MYGKGKNMDVLNVLLTPQSPPLRLDLPGDARQFRHVVPRIDVPVSVCVCIFRLYREVGGWGRVPFSKQSMSPTPRRKWYLTTGRRAH